MLAFQSTPKATRPNQGNYINYRIRKDTYNWGK